MVSGLIKIRASKLKICGLEGKLNWLEEGNQSGSVGMNGKREKYGDQCEGKTNVHETHTEREERVE